MRWWSLAWGASLLVGACIFDWDTYDPRLSGAGGDAIGGRGGATTSAATVGAGAGGGSDCPSGTADCDGEPGCEADLSSTEHCGACNVMCATCGTMLSESFAVAPVGWQWNGDAYHDADAGTVVLTEAVSGAGTAFYATAIVTDSFSAKFEARISDSPAGTGGNFALPGDGMAFVLQQAGPQAVGANGGGLGIAGLTGFGFELDTYNNAECGDPMFEHAAIVDLTACGRDLVPTTLQASAALSAPLPETGWHVIEIEFQAGAAAMSLDAVEVVTATVPRFTRAPYFYGFGAGTAGAVNRHEVRNVTIDFPTPRCL